MCPKHININETALIGLDIQLCRPIKGGKETAKMRRILKFSKVEVTDQTLLTPVTYNTHVMRN